MAKKKSKVAPAYLGPRAVTADEIGPETAAVKAKRRRLLGKLRDGSITFEELHEMATTEAHEIDLFNDHVQAARRRLARPPKAEDRPSGHRPAGHIVVRRALEALCGKEDAALVLHEYQVPGDWTVAELGSAEAYMFDSAKRLLNRERREIPQED